MAQTKILHTNDFKISEHILHNKILKFGLFRPCHFLIYDEDAVL